MSEIKKLEKSIDGRKFTLYSDGRVFNHPHTTQNGRKWDGGFLKECKTNSGYMSCSASVKGVRVGFSAHRVVAEVMLDDWDDKLHVDHKNGDRSDNRPENLRMVTSAENHRSFKKKRSSATGKFRGVYWSSKPQKWIAQVSIGGGKNVYAGSFLDEEEAAAVFDAFAYANGYLKEALNFSVRSAQNLLLCTLAVANNK